MKTLSKLSVVLRGVVVPVTVFAVSLLAVVALDRHLRLRDGEIRTGGLPEIVWFGAHALCALIPLALVIAVVRRLESVWAKISLIAATLVIGWLLYIYILLHYVTGSGIDSL
ncbi:MAG: hypothetical protein NVV63_02390 [Opitutus sp.]|nr:hypothetical protein [Opitutus sp.]